MARELINRIQNLRKETGFEITDRIIVTVSPNEEAAAAIHSFGEFIKNQVLANSILVAENNGTEIEFDDFKLNILVQKHKKEDCLWWLNALPPQRSTPYYILR